MGGVSSFVGNLTGGLIGTSDAEKAAGQANRISDKAKKEILGELDTSWGDIQGYLDPYIKSGADALTKYKAAAGLAPDAPVFDKFNFDYTKMENNPAYQFVKNQGLQAVDRLQAANRNLGSGNRMTAITDYATGIASNEYGNEFGRQLQSYNANQNATARTFGAANTQYNTNMQNIGNLMNQGYNANNFMTSLRDKLAGSRSSAMANRAAEATAAALIPAQEKMSFTNALIGAGGMAAGGYLSKPG